MEKIKNFLLSMNFAVMVFMLIGMRITIMGASIGDALALLSVCGLQAFNRWMDSKKVIDLNETVAKELTDIKTNMAGLMIKNSVRPNSQQSQDVKRFF